MKNYDEKYFRRWYHAADSRIVSATERTRRIAMVVSTCEYLLGRTIRSVLDVGCGEAPWQPVLRRLRPKATYLGMDSSDYAVRRFGASRGIVHGTFSALGQVIPERYFDLVVSSDVIHYLGRKELEGGFASLAGRIGGVAYLDFFTSSDDVEGDLKEMQLRSPRYYLKLFRSHGLQPVGMQFHAGKRIAGNLTAMESVCASLQPR